MSYIHDSQNMTEIKYSKYPFGTKIRHHVSTNNYLPIEELKFIPDSYPEAFKSIDWSEVFINGMAPKYLDIGCGRGKFLISRSFEIGDDNILGIEIRPEPVNWINVVIEGESLKNCKALHYSVANNMPFIESNSVSEIYYLFPDPWVKRKHFKKRAFTEKFLSECHRVMTEHGSLFLATDVPEVHEYQINLLRKVGLFEINVLQSRDEWLLPVTNKERFCIRKNIDVYRTICTKG